jgi:hypothetical protein
LGNLSETSIDETVTAKAGATLRIADRYEPGYSIYEKQSQSFHPIIIIMNILIENNDTREYLMSPGKWSKDPLEGKHFPATIVALRAARLETVGKFNIVFHIPDTNQFVNLDHGQGAGL